MRPFIVIIWQWGYSIQRKYIQMICEHKLNRKRESVPEPGLSMKWTTGRNYFQLKGKWGKKKRRSKWMQNGRQELRQWPMFNPIALNTNSVVRLKWNTKPENINKIMEMIYFNGSHLVGYECAWFIWAVWAVYCEFGVL